MLWQYRTILFEFTKDGLLGDKYVDDEEMEKTLNQLGGQSWELVDVTLLQDGVLAFLKRPAGEEMVVEEVVEAGVSREDAEHVLLSGDRNTARIPPKPGALPAVRWKVQNLAKLKQDNPEKHAEQRALLDNLFRQS